MRPVATYSVARPLEKHFLAINKLEQSYDLYKHIDYKYHYYLIISPWKRELAHPLNKLESPFYKDAVCHINLGKIGQVHLEKVVHYHYVDITSHWQGMWPSNLKKTLIPSPKDVGQNFAFSPGKLKRGLTLLCFAYHAVYHQFSESSMH